MLRENLSGKLRISRTQSNQEPDYVSIYLTDKTSGLEVVQLTLSMEEFGTVLSGMGTDCTFTYNENPDIGKQRETKHVVIHVPEYLQGRLYDKELFRLFMDYAESEVQRDHFGAESWKMDRDAEYRTSKNRDGGTGYSVALRRHI